MKFKLPMKVNLYRSFIIYAHIGTFNQVANESALANSFRLFEDLESYFTGSQLIFQHYISKDSLVLGEIFCSFPMK